jgi:hypothetical protein
LKELLQFKIDINKDMPIIGFLMKTVTVVKVKGTVHPRTGHKGPDRE